MYEQFLRQPFMSTVAVSACSAQVWLTGMCQFELALAQVEERAGDIPPGCTQTFRQLVKPEAFDIAALAADTASGGNVAIPFVSHAKKLLPAAVRSCFHRGATSQDVIDSTLMLLLKPRLARCIELLDTAITGGGRLMDQHAATAMIGRTLTQQALPMTAGAKIAQWLAGLVFASRRLKQVHAHGLFVQFGGPVGVQHGLTDGLELMAALAHELDLDCPPLPWHTNRQPILAIIDAIDAVAVAMEKVALDVALLAQTEIAEMREPPETGAGGSSSMPHKVNPVGCVRIRAAACQIHAVASLLHSVAAQPHERAFGEWHAEWAPLVDATLLLEGALETFAILLPGLRIDAERMLANLHALHGANLRKPTLALLTTVMPADRARELVDTATHESRERGVSYASALLALPEVAANLNAEAVRVVADPAAYVGTSRAQVARIHALVATEQTDAT